MKKLLLIWGLVTLTLVAAGCTTVPIQPGQYGKVTGKVLFGDTDIPIVSGQAVSGAKVADLNIYDGTFTLTGLTPGTQSVTVTCPLGTTTASVVVDSNGNGDAGTLRIAKPLGWDDELFKQIGQVSGQYTSRWYKTSFKVWYDPNSLTIKSHYKNTRIWEEISDVGNGLFTFTEVTSESSADIKVYAVPDGSLAGRAYGITTIDAGGAITRAKIEVTLSHQQDRCTTLHEALHSLGVGDGGEGIMNPYYSDVEYITGDAVVTLKTLYSIPARTSF